MNPQAGTSAQRARAALVAFAALTCVPALALAQGNVRGGGAEAPKQLTLQAKRELRRGAYEAAIRESKAALQRDEKYTDAMEVMARAYYQLGKNEFAEAICDIALSINPKSGECYNLKGFIALRLEDEPRALQMFKKGTEVAPDYGPPWLNLGSRYVDVKNYREAVPALERAVELMGDRAEAHLNLGAAYRGLGRLEDAQRHLTKAMRLRPNYPAAFFNLGILYLDADKYPGIDKVQQLQLAISNLTKYKSLQRFSNSEDPVDTYLRAAEREITREKRTIERDKQRKAREAAKQAAEAAKAKEKPKAAAEPAKPAPTKAAPTEATPSKSTAAKPGDSK